MVKEVLDVMVDLAKEGMTMICVTHEMGFAKEVADRIVFMDEGRIVADRDPENFFNNTGNERVKEFLSQILQVMLLNNQCTYKESPLFLCEFP